MHVHISARRNSGRGHGNHANILGQSFKKIRVENFQEPVAGLPLVYVEIKNHRWPVLEPGSFF